MTIGQRTLRVGTRGSALALEQTHRVIAALERLDPELRLEPRVITTSGDIDKRTPLAIIGGQGVFAKELQAALLDGAIDLAVHSAKDLPSGTVPGLTLGAFVDREDPRDVLISRDGRRLSELPAGARVGTSSRRRMAALRRLRPDLQAVEFRGNVDTRMRKVREGDVDAAILAAAGVLRMGWGERITEYLPLDDFVPAPGQGALAVECRADDADLCAMLATLDEPDTSLAVRTERAFLSGVGGGCRSPLGAYAIVDGATVTLRAMLADEGISRVVLETRTAPAGAAADMAAALAREMLRAVSPE